MIIDNVLVYSEKEGFIPGYIKTSGDRICEVGFDNLKEIHNDEIVDGNGCYAIPGLIDMHFHGCNGYDVCDGTAEAVREIAKYQASIGVTTIAPATMTLPVDELVHIIESVKEYNENAVEQYATVVGINMEGPFISEVKKGAQDAKYILKPDIEVLNRFVKAGNGLVKVIGIAPETTQVSEFIEKASKEVIVAITHSNSDYDTALRAFKNGASHVTHLFNAISGFNHREPGILGAVCDSDSATVELICDGIHVHPSAVRMAYQLLGEDRIIMISDSIRAAGLGDGTYTLGGQNVKVTAQYARLEADGSLAGSVLSLPYILKIAVKEMNIPLIKAVKSATVNPAKKLGIYDKYGSLEAGKKADIVLLDKDINIKKVIKNGFLI